MQCQELHPALTGDMQAPSHPAAKGPLPVFLRIHEQEETTHMECNLSIESFTLLFNYLILLKYITNAITETNIINPGTKISMPVFGNLAGIELF